MKVAASRYKGSFTAAAIFVWKVWKA